MKDFKKHWPSLSKKISGKHIFLFCDFDGTLTPIKKHPSDVKLKEKTKTTLKELNKHCVLSVVSGRDLKTLKKLVGLQGLIYAGNHGVEMSGPGFTLESQALKKAKPLFKKIGTQLKKEIGSVKGLHLEPKGLALGIHYRQVALSKQDEVVKKTKTILAPYIKKKRVELLAGKKVLEYRYAKLWNKGDAVKWVLKQASGRNNIIFYLGDDVTDEKAFGVLAKRKNAYTIRVGKPKPTKATYRLDTVGEVERFLTNLLNLTKQEE